MGYNPKMEKTDNFATVDFRPKKSLSIGAQLHNILRIAIIQGDLVPGQAISEIEMSKRFSISRQPVREAFIKLGEERLIEVLPQRGTYIRKISAKELLDARHLREVIETSIVREVTLNHDAELIKVLRDLISQQEEVAPGDNQSFLALDDAMHKALAFHAGREYAWRINETIKAQLDRVRYLTYDFTTPKPLMVAEHTEIVDAIESGNPDLAAHKIETHLRRIITDLPLIAERYPEYFSYE